MLIIGTGLHWRIRGDRQPPIWYVLASVSALYLKPILTDNSAGKIVVQLNGRINKTGVISPRYNVHLSQLEKWVVKLLPARQFGVSYISPP